MAKGWGTTKPRVNEDSKRLDQLVDLIALPDDEYVQVRFVGDIFTFSQHWMDIITKQGKKTSIPKLCLNWDPEEEEFADNGCPYCEAQGKGGAINYLANAIVRDLQDAEPRKPVAPNAKERKTGIKTVGSKSWTPVRVVRIPAGAAKKVVDLAALNRVKGEPVPMSDPKYGCDVSIKYDSKASGADKYAVQKGERTAITKEETAYLVYDLDVQVLPSVEDSITECEKLIKMSPDFDGDDDGGRSSAGRKKKVGSKTKRQKKREFEEDELDGEDFDDDLDGDDIDDDADFDDDLDDDDLDEEDEDLDDDDLDDDSDDDDLDDD